MTTYSGKIGVRGYLSRSDGGNIFVSGHFVDTLTVTKRGGAYYVVDKITGGGYYIDHGVKKAMNVSFSTPSAKFTNDDFKASTNTWAFLPGIYLHLVLTGNGVARSGGVYEKLSVAVSGIKSGVSVHGTVAGSALLAKTALASEPWLGTLGAAPATCSDALAAALQAPMLGWSAFESFASYPPAPTGFAPVELVRAPSDFNFV